MVEHLLPKQRVVGSSPISRSKGKSFRFSLTLLITNKGDLESAPPVLIIFQFTSRQE